MIPKYFRCGEPSQKCPLSVTKEIIKENEKWACPCANANCVDFRDPVPLIEGITEGKSWIVYGGGAALALVILLLFMFAGNDSCGTKLEDFRARLESLDKGLVALESKPKSDSNVTQFRTAVSTLESDTGKLQARASKAMVAGDEVEIEKLKNELKQHIDSGSILGQSLVKPESGSGVEIAEAKSAITKLIPLEEELDEQIELTQTQCPKHTAQFEDLSANVAASLSKARRLATPSGSSESVDSNLTNSVTASISKLKAIQEKLGTFSPPPPPLQEPFPRSEADLIIAAPNDLADLLVGPLAAEWSGSKTVPGPNGSIYIDGAPGKKLIIDHLSVEQGFERLARGEIGLFFAGRSPTSAEMAQFGPDFRESRSVAEVVALDALTLLVHPENPMDTLVVGQPISLKTAAGPEGSAVRQKASFFGFRSSDLLETYGEEAALLDRDILALSLFHREGQNLRARRLAVKPSPEAPALKPSPFTIATEEYLYSYRIVAWTSGKPADQALSFVKFITSNPGQALVEQCGFVDLRLKPVPGTVDPRILAALGAALGVDSVNGAQRLSTNIRFAVGDSQLDLKGQADLERIPREVASNYPTHKVVILGYTDTDGGPQINQPLSIKRAETVAAELRRSKVDTRAGGLGSSFPIDTNETEAGKARNRRAEVWVVKP